MAALRGEVDEQLQQLAEERREALRALAAAYLATHTAPALARAEQLSGFRGFSRRDPLVAMEHERKMLIQTVSRIEADATYQRREYLVGPHGEYTRELTERQSMLAEWQQECDRFETLDSFDRLLLHKYDTPEFDLSWWQPAYWVLWAKGDAACVALGMNDFGDDVLPAYEKVRVPRDGWREQVAQTQAKIDAVHDLVRRHDEAVARIPALPQIYLEQCQERLAEFLTSADPGLLHDWCVEGGSDRAILLALRQNAGLKAKMDALEDTRAGLTDPLQDLNLRRQKYQAKVEKYRRAKNYHAIVSHPVDRKFPEKAAKMQAEVHRLRDQIRRLTEYRAYERLDLDQDPHLLWVAMTRQRPTRFSPGLRGWYQRHPHVSARFVDDSREDALRTAVAVGAAAAAMDREDGGYLS